MTAIRTGAGVHEGLIPDQRAEWDALERGETTTPSRLDVYQRDSKVGTVAGDFGVRSVRSTTMLYDVRPGDFRREGDRIVADWTLGPGDLEAAGVSLAYGGE